MLPFRPLQIGDTSSPRRMEEYLRDVERTIEELTARVRYLSQPQATRLTTRDFAAIRAALQSGGVAELDLTNLPGIQADTVDARIPRLTAAPDPYTAPHDTYILVGSPDTLWQIDRTTNPPTAIQISFASTNVLTTNTNQTPDPTVVKTWTAAQVFNGGLTSGGDIVVSTGQFDSASQYGCNAYNNAAQSIPDAVFTGCAFNSESFDQGALHDTAVNNTRITVPAGGAGLWLVTGNISYAANAIGARGAYIFRNGATQEAGSQVPNAGAADSVRVQVAVILNAADADYFELVALQNSGGALNTVANRTIFCAYKLC